MSDPIEKTAAGATRVFFGSLGFILLMVGVERMTEDTALQLASDVILFIAGALCFYLAFFWEHAKKIISPDAQKAVERFAQSRIVKFGMLFLALQALILLPFIEYPRSQAQVDAAKWQFAYNLKHGLANSGYGQVGLTCHYVVAGRAPWWGDIVPVLDLNQLAILWLCRWSADGNSFWTNNHHSARRPNFRGMWRSSG